MPRTGRVVECYSRPSRGPQWRSFMRYSSAMATRGVVKLLVSILLLMALAWVAVPMALALMSPGYLKVDWRLATVPAAVLLFGAGAWRHARTKNH